MSFALDFAPDAKSQWRDLEIEVQEVVLDEMERLAANPPQCLWNCPTRFRTHHLRNSPLHFPAFGRRP